MASKIRFEILFVQCFFFTLGKEDLFRVSKKTLGKKACLHNIKKHSAKTLFDKCFLTFDKEVFLPSIFFADCFLGKLFDIR